METIYRRNEPIRAGQMDTLRRLNLPHTIELFQDMTAAHSELLQISNRRMHEKSDAFWVVTRMKLRFYQPLFFPEEITCETWPLMPGTLACGRCYRILKDGATAVEGRSEWLLLDRRTHSPRRVDTTCYPLTEEHETSVVLPEPFLRFKETLGEEDLVYETTVRSSDIDMSHHTNNVQYVRMMMNALSVSEWEALTPRTFEIRYERESREGDPLQIARRAVPDGFLFQITRSDGTRLASARLTVTM